MQIIEPWFINIPASIIFELAISYGQITLFYERERKEPSFQYVFENELSKVIVLACLYMMISYAASISVIYLNNKTDLILNQLQVARLTLRVVMNHLNEAIFLLTDEGMLCYSN